MNMVKKKKENLTRNIKVDLKKILIVTWPINLTWDFEGVGDAKVSAIPPFF